MKQHLLIVALAVLMSNTTFAGINYTEQTANIERLTMTQQGGNNNTQIINDAKSESEWVGVKQKVTSDRADINQKDTKNSNIYLNKAEISGKTVAFQNVDIKKVNIKQQNGNGNKVALNRVDVKK